MKLIVLGCGRAGSYLANHLAEQGHEITVIDQNPLTFRALKRGLPIRDIQGSGADIDVLKEAGIEEADALAAVTDNDHTNLMACLMAKRIFRVPAVVAGLANPKREALAHQFGLEAVCPLTLGAQRIIQVLLKE